MRSNTSLWSSRRALLLVAVLLSAQWAMAQHGADLAAHADHVCEWSLAHAPLAAGAATPPLALLDLLAYVAPASASASRLATGSPAAYQTRAPPFSFSV